ncbi:MAG: hypothetical protein ACYC21_03315 [Eubacteriales bacterium]
MRNFLKKEFLLGIGIGFIISAVLVSVFGTGGLSDEEIMARAAKLGMVVQTPATESSTNNDSAEKSPAPVAKVKEPVKEPAKEPVKEPSQGEVPAQPTHQSVSITVTSGMGSEAVARELEEKGAIRDQHEFLKVVDEHHAQARLQNGTFKIPAGGDLEEILKILTARKRG